MRRLAVTLAGIVLALASAPLLAGTAHASCIAAQIGVSRTTVKAESQVRVTGQNFAAECNDTTVNGQTPTPSPPITGIRIVFVQGGRTAVLRTVDADASYRFSVVVTVPAWAVEGEASLRASETATVALTVASDSATPATKVTDLTLPVTGSGTVRPNALLALALLASGALLLVVARRRTPVGRHRA